MILMEHTMRVFFEKYALPKQPLPTLTDFLNPKTHFLEPSRIIHWTHLSTYFGIPHYLDPIFNTSPDQWHITLHCLPTFSSLCAFSSVTEKLGFRRAREIIHQEMARRIRCLAKWKRARGTREYLRLLKLGYEEMRIEAGKWVDREGEGVWVDCPGCRIRPGFVCDTMHNAMEE